MLFFLLLHRNNQISFKHKNFSSTGFENKSEFFGAKMVVFKKGKVLTELLNCNHIRIFHNAIKNCYGVLPNMKCPVALDLKWKVKFLVPKW